MRFELNSLRELMEVQLGTLAWNQLQGSRPAQANLYRRLQRIGLSGPLSRDLLEMISGVEEPRQAWRMLLAHLARMISTPEVEPLEEGGVIAMVGPAGMGKTTTLAKLAARYVLKYGAQSIALVSMDSYRIGAQEQLKTLGRILNVSVTHVDPGQSLVQALDPLLRKRVVLIDTAGLPGSAPELRMQLEAMARLDSGLVKDHSGSDGGKQAKGLHRLSDALGRQQDLRLLRNHMRGMPVLQDKAVLMALVR